MQSRHKGRLPLWFSFALCCRSCHVSLRPYTSWSPRASVCYPTSCSSKTCWFGFILVASVFRVTDFHLWSLFYFSVSQKTLPASMKRIKNTFLPCFRYESGYEWYMDKPLRKNLQNIDSNKSVKFGVCKCCWREDLWFRVWENKFIFENGL